MQKLISLVIPVFNEEKNIASLFEQLNLAIKQAKDYNFEVIFVNDGSKDNSFLAIYQLAQQHPWVKIIDFSRNFGKEIALTAGCHQANGDAVITLDADLQHPPELIADLIEKWEAGFDVVYTVRMENKGASLIKRFTSWCYWTVFSKVSSIDSEPHSTDFRLMDRKVNDIFKRFPEKGRIFRGIIDWIGYRRARLEFIAPERMYGQATYSYKGLMNLAVNSLTSFSMLPLKIAGYLGIIITSFSFFVLIVMLIVRFFIDHLFFTSLAFVVVMNTLLMGIVLISLGLIALYIARIHDEVNGRPLYIVKEKINFNKNKD